MPCGAGAGPAAQRRLPAEGDAQDATASPLAGLQHEGMLPM